MIEINKTANDDESAGIKKNFQINLENVNFVAENMNSRKKLALLLIRHVENAKRKDI